MSAIGKRLTVDQYDLMVTNGILPEVNYLELVEGKIVEKCRMTPLSACAAGKCAEVLRGLVPAGWYVRECGPVRIPSATASPSPRCPWSAGSQVSTGNDILTRRTSPWSSRSRGGTASTSRRIGPWPRPTAPAASRPTGSSTLRAASSRSTPTRGTAHIQLPRSWERESPSI